MARGTRLFAAFVAFAATVVFSSIGAESVAQPAPAAATRDAALRALAARLNLPLLDEAVGIFSTQVRRSLPALFVASVGQQANLGPRWKRGDPTFDDAVGRIDAALGAEEALGGPLVKLQRSDLLYAVNVPWTRDDIAFVDATLDTPIGHEAERALDARATLQTIATLKRRIAVGVDGRGLAAAFADLDARAQAQFGDAMLTLLALRGTDPQRAARLQRLVESVTLAPSDAIGQRMVDRLSQRLLDAAATHLPEVLAAIAGFRTGP